MQLSSLIVVDDEPDLCELIADYLTRHGFEILTACNGAELDIRLAEGTANLLIPMDSRFNGAAGSIAFRSLLIPHTVLGPLMAGRELTRACHLKADAPLGILLAASLNAAASQIPLLTDELGDAVLTNLSGLVALAIGTSDEGHMAGRDAVRVARLHRVKEHVGKHLAIPCSTRRLSPRRWACRCGSCTCCSSRRTTRLRTMSCGEGWTSAGRPWPTPPLPAGRSPTWRSGGASIACRCSTARSRSPSGHPPAVSVSRRTALLDRDYAMSPVCWESVE